MCGIFGIISYENNNPSVKRADSVKQIIMDLLMISEMRGRDASGIAVVSGNKAFMYKNSVPGSVLPDMPKFKRVLNTINPLNRFSSMIGHVRAQTKGSYKFNVNNHPILAGTVIGVHNGVIQNDDLLFDSAEQISSEAKFVRKGQVDSEIIFQLINHYLKIGYSLNGATKKATELLNGSYTCAFIDANDSERLVLFSGSGSSFPSLAIWRYEKRKLIIFASSNHILERVTMRNDYLPKQHYDVEIKSTPGFIINSLNGTILNFEVSSGFGNTVMENYYAS